jgi:hypothetical protein
LSIEVLRAKRPYNHDIVDTENQIQRPSRAITTNRTTHVIQALEDQLAALIPDEEPFSVVSNDYITLKLKPNAETDFTLIENTLYDLIPYWENVTLNYAWVSHQHPLGSTLHYENTDRLVPHPDTKAFAVLAESNNWSREMEEKMRSEFEQEWNAYEIDEDNPRFTYGPKQVLNGDYGMAGVDIAVALENKKPPVMFDVGNHNDTIAFPSENDPATKHHTDAAYTDMCSNSDNHVSVIEVSNHTETVMERHPECPNPILTPRPTNGLQTSFN